MTTTRKLTKTPSLEKEYQFNELPPVMDKNYFYCFNPRTGTIRIGKIIGKSAITNYTTYKIGSLEFKEFRHLSEDRPSLELSPTPFLKRLKAFMYYKDLMNEYNKYVEAKLKRAKSQKIRYIVSTDIFLCKMTRAASIPYGFKAFDSKEEAIEFSNKGLKTLKTKLDKYIPIFMDAQKELRAIQIRCSGTKTFDDIIVTPKNITEKDILTKIVYKHYKSHVLPEVDEEYITKVNEFLSADVARLSDDTLLSHKECSPRIFPMFIKLDSVKAAKDRLRFINSERLLENIKWYLERLNRVKNYVHSYEPLKKVTGMSNVYFIESNIKNVVEDLNTLIPKLKEK